MKFDQLGLSESTLKALKQKGFETPTPIQALTIPALLQGQHDIVAQAQTGTGKTAAFALPLIEKLQPGVAHVQALVLAPTRELAQQVAQEIDSLKGSKRLEVVTVYGGQSIVPQLRALKNKVAIVVGTPGRVIDHIEQGSLKLDKLSHVILDEADEILNRGFLEDLTTILDHTPQDKQMLLFSATMRKEILSIAQKYMRDYEFLKVEKQQLTCDMIEQIYYHVSHPERFSALCRIIDTQIPFYGIVFCRTKRESEEVAEKLSSLGYAADVLNGNMSQASREKILDKFKRKVITILVATDVAARGIDVKDVSHVINYKLPEETETYTHRIGRTGRAGTKGIAISLVSPKDKYQLGCIERAISLKITEKPLPTPEALIAHKKEAIITQLTQKFEKAPQQFYTQIAQELLENQNPETVVAVLLKQAFSKQLEAPKAVAFKKDTEERGERRGSRGGDRGNSRGGSRGGRSRGFSRNRREGGSGEKRSFRDKKRSGSRSSRTRDF